MGLNLPIAIYDVAGRLVPGIVLPMVLAIRDPGWLNLYRKGFLFGLVFAWIAGQLIQALCEKVVHWLAKRRLWKPKLLLEDRKYGLKPRVLRNLRDYYGSSVAADAPIDHIKNLAYSPVWDRMDNYRIFVALADLNRGLGFLALLAIAQLTSVVVCTPTASALSRTQAGWLMVLSAGLFLLFIDRFCAFTRLSDVVVYYSFLSYTAHEKCRFAKAKVGTAKKGARTI